MEFEGKVWKNKSTWLVEVPSLDLMTQGKSKAGAIEILESLVLDMVRYTFKKTETKGFKVFVEVYKDGTIGLSSSENKVLLSLSLKRQREKSESTVRQVAGRLGSKYPNAYAQYEKGKMQLSIEKYEQLLNATNPGYKCLLKVI